MTKEKTVNPAVNADLNDNLKQAYRKAYELGAQKLCSLDIHSVAKAAQVEYDDNKSSYLISFLNNNYYVSSENGQIEKVNSANDTIPITSQVLIVHYLITAQDLPLSGNAISFKELPQGGAIYCSNFQKRAIDPMVKRFSKDFDAFYDAARSLGGSKIEAGHAGVELKIFPKLPVRYVIWQGDEEIASSGTILFDKTADSFLPVEDIVVAASEGTYAMLRAAGK